MIKDKTDETVKLDRIDVGIIWPFSKRIIIEPRKKDGSLDVSRIGADEIVRQTQRIKTDDQLAKLFFWHHPKAESATGQAVMDWLCDNGLTVRTRTW